MKSYVKEKVVKLQLADGWQGLAVEKWADLAFEPEKLTENPQAVFKSAPDSITGLKELEDNGKILKVSFVFKKNVSRFKGRTIVDFVRGAKAVRNFNLALELNGKQIDSARPAAALWRRNGLRKIENIYLAEYIPGSMSLYDIAFGKNLEIISNFRLRKEVINQVAQIIAKLRKGGYWHRDSKAGNFIVYKNGDEGYRVKLIDLDGIKLNFVFMGKNNIRTLSKLAETLTRFKAVNFTDLYRGFLYYCEEMKMYHGERRRLFRQVERMTVAKRLMTIIADSYKLNGEQESLINDEKLKIKI